MKNTTHHIPTSHSHSHNVFDNPEAFIEKFDGIDRESWQKPDEIIKTFRLSPDAIVFDVGAGTGYFCVRLAEHIKEGKIIAFESAQKMAGYLQDRVNILGLTHVDVRITGSDGELKTEEKADLIFSVDVYHHLENRIAYMKNISHYLKPDGVLVVIDRTEQRIEGQPMGHRVSSDKVKEEMKEAGFELVEELDFLLPIQYYLAFKK